MAKPRQQPKQQVGVPDVSRNNWPIIIGSVLVILAIAVVAVVATQSGGSDNAAEADTIEWQPSTITGTPLPPYSNGQGGDVNEAVGSVAPEVRGKNFTNGDVAIANNGKPKAVIFLAHWCPHCQAELPKISDWLKTNRTKYDIEYYAVATATNNRQPNFPPSDWLAEEGFREPVIVDDRANKVANAYGVTGYPFMVFLDKENKVVARTSGEIGVAEFEAKVAAATRS